VKVEFIICQTELANDPISFGPIQPTNKE